MRRIVRGRELAVLLAAWLAGCAGQAPAFVNDDAAPGGSFDASGIPDAVPRLEPPSRYGNPASYVVFGKTYRVLKSAENFRERGRASWYGTKFHGRRTSSGEPYDMYAMTAAHKTLPLPSYVRVTNLDNGRSVVVRVNDRGPFHDGRIIDLSYAAALRLDVVGTGTAPVEIEAIVPGAEDGTAPAPRPATGVAGPAAGDVFIQLGAFSSSENALELKGRLEQAGIRPVRIDDGHAGGLLRVRLGPYAAAAADEVALRLVALGLTDFTIAAE